MLKVLISLLYCDRPNMVKNALRSIVNLKSDNWELAFIDDGSGIPGEPIVRNMLHEHLDKVKFYRCDDTKEQKLISQSRQGEYVNLAIQESDADLGILVCDDDAVVPDSLSKLSDFYENYPEVMYSYSHVIVFDPFTDVMENAVYTPHWLNRYTEPIYAACQVDCSQASYRLKCFKEFGAAYVSPQNAGIDASLYEQLGEMFGRAPFNGVVLQYKGIHKAQMGRRDPSNLLTIEDLP